MSAYVGVAVVGHTIFWPRGWQPL